MVKLILPIYIITIASHLSFASNKEETIKMWKSADEIIQASMDKVEKSELTLPSDEEKFNWGGNILVCYDITGEEITKDECGDARLFASSLNKRKIESIKGLWQNDKCRTSLDVGGFCQTDYQNLKKSNQEIKKLLDEYKVIALKTIPKSFQSYQSRVIDNLNQLVIIEKQLENPTEVIKMVKRKLQSKECKLFRVTADVCRKAYVESAANQGIALEEEATKQSGVVNRYSRYKLGQMKALHGTGNLSQLKKQYRQLSGSDWNVKTCETSPDLQKKYDSGELSSDEQEIEACGCVGLDCQDLE